MAEHKHGTMEVREQEKTFAGFVKVSIWIAGISIGAVIFMAIFNS
ncbi:MAG: aa3-type cytochrome c oxidase subunit IV [Rhodobacteraceae bacterium]|nr:aa3-type cytochrome c oxidase subunit IV [Paracoccaceae bacterium]